MGYALLTEIVNVNDVSRPLYLNPDHVESFHVTATRDGVFVATRIVLVPSGREVLVREAPETVRMHLSFAQVEKG